MPIAVPVQTGTFIEPPGDSRLVFATINAQRRVYTTMRLEGSILRVVELVEQMR